MSHLTKFAESQYQAALIQLEAAKNLLEQSRIQQEIDDAPNWVYIDEAAKRIGLTKNAVYARARLHWTVGIQYKRERPGKKTRLIFNMAEIQKWLDNIEVYNSIMANSESGLNGTESQLSSPSTSTQPRRTGRQPPDCVMKYIKK